MIVSRRFVPVASPDTSSTHFKMGFSRKSDEICKMASIVIISVPRFRIRPQTFSRIITVFRPLPDLRTVIFSENF